MFCINVSKMKKNDYKRVFRYEIQGRKYQKIVKNLDCVQWYHAIESHGVGVWGFGFYLRTKKGIIDLTNRMFRPWFRSCCTSKFFCKKHIPEFLPF